MERDREREIEREIERERLNLMMGISLTTFNCGWNEGKPPLWKNF